MVSLLLIKTSKYFSKIFREKFIKVYIEIKFSRGKKTVYRMVFGGRKTWNIVVTSGGVATESSDTKI